MVLIGNVFYLPVVDPQNGNYPWLGKREGRNYAILALFVQLVCLIHLRLNPCPLFHRRKKVWVIWKYLELLRQIIMA